MTEEAEESKQEVVSQISHNLDEVRETNGHAEETEQQQLTSAKANSKAMSKAGPINPSDGHQSVEPAVMGVERKKQAEIELNKFIQNRLVLHQKQQSTTYSKVEMVKQVKESETENIGVDVERLRLVDENEELTSDEKGVSENEPTVRADVVREADTDNKDEYPEEGLAKNLLSKFQTLAAEATITKTKEHRPSGIASKPTGKLMVRTRGEADASHFINADSDDEQSGGVFESQPILRTDVVKEDDRNDEEELPRAGLTKTLLSVFKDISTSGQNTPVKPPSRSGSISGGRIHELLLASGESEFCSENDPVVRENVVREGETKDTEDRPVQGTTKGLLTMFGQVSESAEEMKKKLHKPSGVARKRWRAKDKIGEEDENISKREIVKETTDVVNEEELPKSGQAGGLLKKFRSMETANKTYAHQYQHAWTADTSKVRKSQQNIQRDDKETKQENAGNKAAETAGEDNSQTRNIEVSNSTMAEDGNKSAPEAEASPQREVKSSRKVTSIFIQKDSNTTTDKTDMQSKTSNNSRWQRSPLELKKEGRKSNDM